MADNLKVFGTTYYDVQGQKFTDLDGNEKTYIRPVGTKQIAQNGTADVKKFEFAEVAVPASAVDEGTKQITQNGDGQDVIGYAAVDVNVPGIVPAGTKQINQNGTHDVTQYASAEVNVPNTYAASDEGKVVQSGALVSQSSQTIDTNGTYDTTTKNEVVVDVQSGGGGVGTLVTVATAKSLAKESINELFSGFAPLSNNWYLVGMLTNKAVADYVDYQLLTFFYRANSSSWGCFARYRTEGSSIGYNHQSQIGNTSRADIAVGDTYQIFAPEYLG